MDLRPRDLILRCYAEQAGDQWQAFCLDLDLAAQGDSFLEVRDKLHEQIAEYVFDALAGEDQEHAGPLLSRKAPVSLWAKYYWASLVDGFSSVKDGVARAFAERLPLAPKPPLGHA